MLVRSCWRRAIAKVAPVSATFTRDISQTDSAAQTSTSYTGVVAAATVVAVFATHPRQSALEEEVVEKHGPPADALPADASLAWRRRYFFKYERRLREGSTPQRIYSYFANNHNGVHALPKSHVDDYVMNASDVMRSLYSVYPHGVGGSPIVRNGWFRGEDLVRGQLSVNDAFVKEDARMEAVVQKLRNEQRRAGGKGRAKKSDILQALSDADGEAGVSYIEWILVDTLLGYEVGDMEKSFLLLFRSLDLDGSGQIDAGELEVVLRMLLETRDGLSDGGDFASGFGHGGERELAHLGETSAKMLGLMNGGNASGAVDFDRFVDFCKALRVNVEQLHFAYYTEGEETVVSAANLLTSVVAHCADLTVVDRYLDRIDAARSAGSRTGMDAQFSFETFRAIHDLVEGEFRDLLAVCSLWCRFYRPGGDGEGRDKAAAAGRMNRDGFRLAVARLKGASWIESHGDALDALFWLFARNSDRAGEPGELHLADLNAALGKASGRRSRHGLENFITGNVDGFGSETKLQCVLRCFNLTTN